MACTGQSASQYVESVRRHLVRGLKSLSVILENLFQQEVLCEEEVSKIQAEKDDFDKRRRIVDKVLKKGEGACYEFLRIIDKTRKRTLERPYPDTNGFDLHYWISCYPFREETKMDKKYQQGPEQCHNFQNRLKSKAQKLYQKFWMSKKNLCRPNLSYSPLVLDTQGIPCPSKIKKLKTKKSKMSRPKKLRTYVPEETVRISPSDLMKTNKPVLLVGKPGIGKTAVVLEMLRLWTERDDADLDYMIYFDMREDSHFKTAMKLQDLLFSEFSQSDEDRDEVLRDIMKNSENVTMIFDEVTDLHSSSVVQKLVEKDLLPDAKIIVTCRPDNEGDIVDDLPEDFFFRVEVKGFSEQTIRTYLSENLGEEHKQVLNNLELFTLCHVPMYALMVAVCFSSETQPCTITDLYINIVRFCLQKNSKTTKRLLNSFIKKEGEKILALAEAAFDATERKSVILTGLGSEDTCVCPFLKTLDVEVAPTDTETTSIFLHYTMQEFFAALWLLKNPGKIKDVLQQCFAEEKKHMKHLIPFMCRLLSEKAPRLMEYLIPADELKKTSKLFFEELNTTLIPHELNQQSETEDSAVDVDMVFLCQCLYESQSPETCLLFLDKLDFCLDLSGHCLDPFSCCAVSYVVTQSKEKKVKLNLEDVTISEEGVRRLHGCLKNVHWCSPLPCQLWKSLLFCVEQTDHNSSRGLNGNQLHLPVNNKSVADCDTLVTVLWRDANDCFYWDKTTPANQSLYKVLSKVLPNINSLSFVTQTSDASEETKLLGNLFCTAAEGEKLLQLLSSVCTYHGYPLTEKWMDFQLDLYSYEPEVALKVLPALQSVLQSVPTVWSINLSERKASILLEVLKLQSEKKTVNVTGWSHEESEVRSFLQCLPYISQLRYVASNTSQETKFCGNLFFAATESEQQTGEKILQLLSVCMYQGYPLTEKWVDFQLDLYSYEPEVALKVLPALQSVLQSVPTVWIIDLSERKASILLEVLKLQSEKKQVEVTGWSHEESEVRSFLQCLPFISQLRSYVSDDVKFFGNLFCAAAERDQQTGEKNLQILSSLCTYPTFPFNEDDEDLYPCQSDFLLDLYCHVKDYDSTTGMSVLPALQSVLQSVPTVWIIDLSERKASILLEVLKLQSEKKQVKVTGWSHEESEVRSFLPCLPYISQLRSNFYDDVKFFGNLFCAAAERDQQTGEKNLQIFSSLCTYPTFPFNEDDVDLYPCQSDFLLDLYCHVKDYDSTTGMSVLPALQSVLQSVPTVWIIDLSKRKASILLEVLKLQSEKKQVKVTGWSHEESEVRSFLQCLPYISQLRSNFYDDVKFCGNLFCAAAERDQQTGEKNLQILSSLCTYPTFPFDEDDEDLYPYQCDFLLDLCCHVKDYDSTTGMSVLPALQSVLQSVPTVWIIDLSKRKASILLEVLKLQSEKKQVKVTGWSHEESEVRSFLQCLPYISQLSCYPAFFQEVCSSISIRSREETQQLASLLKLQGFSLLLEGELNQKTCCTVGRVLRFCGHKVDLILTPTKISTRGASVLFKHTSQLHSLRLSDSLASLLFRWMKRKRVVCTFAVPELHLVSKTNKRSEPALLKVVSRVSCLLRYWTVRCLDLTEFCVPALSLITLLLHDASLKIKLNKDNYQQLVTLLYEIQDKDLSCSFVSKCGGDLSACCLNWELLHYLLQQSRHTFTMNVRKNTFLQENITHLLPFLDSIQFLRPSPSFVLAAIREIDKAQVRHIIPGFLKSLDHMLTLTCRKLDSADFAALLFTLKHSDKVKVNLLWTSIPTEGTESLLFTLDRVSQLSVDRYLLLRLVHCCAASNVHQRAASGLLQSLQHRLDLSSSSCVALSDRDEREVLSLTADDCRAISIILRHISEDTQLDLRDCEVEDSGLDLLLPVPDRVHLRASKAVVLSLLSLVPVNSERDTVRRTESLWKALRGELDLSHTMLDQRTCGALALMLDLSEGLTELDLSHCQLTDQLLLMLSAHLHKVQVLDLSHNQITDASTDVFLQLCSVNTSTQTVRLFSNNIVDRTPFNEDKRFEMW
uniref:Uncharacterized LOC115415582 n=1 Tax=Sphaeramia orbicularis TaxID=375764 RepID=A0A672YZL5_9TELE